MSFFKHLDSFFKQLFTIRSAVSPEYCKLKNILVESVLTDRVLFTLGLSFKAFLIIELVMFLGKPFQDEKFLISRISLLRLSLQQIHLALTTKEVIHDVFHFHSVKELNIGVLTSLCILMVNTQTIWADFNI